MLGEAIFQELPELAPFILAERERKEVWCRRGSNCFIGRSVDDAILAECSNSVSIPGSN